MYSSELITPQHLARKAVIPTATFIFDLKVVTS
jgi:hypothetical protein